MSSQPAGTPPPTDPDTAIRSGAYLRLLVFAAVLGVPLSAFAWGFLAATSKLQDAVFTDLPRAWGFASAPVWWPLPVLTLAGLLVGATVRYLPGTGGHLPADGLKTGGPPAPARELPGILLAALASIGLGAIIGPEAPLIALGGGLAVAALRLAKRDVPATSVSVVAASGSFAAISALLGSPLAGAFLLMEASGLGGATLRLVLVPGLLSAGIGALVFVGLGHWSGLGTLSLGVPNLPEVGPPTAAQFGWAIVIGLFSAFFATGIRRAALALAPTVGRHPLIVTPVAGLAIAVVAVIFAEATGQSTHMVLFSGQTALGPLLTTESGVAGWILVVLLVTKGAGYLIALSAFRGGPIFPALFLGAAGGLALAHLPGLPAVSGAAMGIAAMATAMLGLPLTAVLLTALLLRADGLALMPLVIVAAVVAYVASGRLGPRPVNQQSVKPVKHSP